MYISCTITALKITGICTCTYTNKRIKTKEINVCMYKQNKIIKTKIYGTIFMTKNKHDLKFTLMYVLYTNIHSIILVLMWLYVYFSTQILGYLFVCVFVMTGNIPYLQNMFIESWKLIAKLILRNCYCVHKQIVNLQMKITAY